MAEVMADEIGYEREIWIAAKDGVGIAPRILDCPECHEPMRHRPGHRYVCECGAETVLDMTPLEYSKRKVFD
jgi:hypothetical protein